MTQYRGDPQAVRALVREDSVHRDLYINAEIFDLEMEHLWRNTWIYVGHDSQVPSAGDFYTTTLARQPVIMLRGSDDKLRVLFNRCSHKGTRVLSALSGHAAVALRCPYHGWTFRYDGSLRTMPAKAGYDGTALAECQAGRGLVEVKNVCNYRGFVFARISAHGTSFGDYFGESLSSIDNMVDRAPEGRLEVAGGVLRYMHDCNWKMFVENLNDTMHPMVAHESSAGTAKALWDGQPADAPKPMVIEQFLPFVNGYDFFDQMGVKIYDNGHSYTGVNFSIHSKYSAVPAYEAALVGARGEEEARRVLGVNRHNTVYFPSLTIKGAIQTIRVARPIAYNRTVLESFTLRLVGAPPELLQRTVMYSRLINAPTSVVGHDDLACYRGIQLGLETEGNDWVSLHRGYSPREREQLPGVFNGNNEVSMRGQFRAWAKFMTMDMDAPAAR
jgi:benzoate/toluate 1,2-dioxygenase subunit alpha